MSESKSNNHAPRARPDYGEIPAEKWKVGHRVEIHPGCDMWMRGARFGEVTSLRKGGYIVVRLDLDPRRRHSFDASRIRPEY